MYEQEETHVHPLNHPLVGLTGCMSCCQLKGLVFMEFHVSLKLTKWGRDLQYLVIQSLKLLFFHPTNLWMSVCVLNIINANNFESSIQAAPRVCTLVL